MAVIVNTMTVIVNTMAVIVNTMAVIVNTMTVIMNTILPYLRVWWVGRPSAPPGTPYTAPRSGRGGS